MAVTLDHTIDLSALRKWYRVYDDVDVIATLRRHPGLVPLLEETAVRMPQYFPENTTLRLEVLKDPDDADGHAPKLYAVIETSLPLPDARARLYRLRDDWWRDASHEAVGVLSLVVD